VQAYEQVDKATMTGRNVEIDVLNRAARKLTECQENWKGADHETRLKDALKYNQLVWSIFQSELEKEDNPLPRKIRLDLLRLISFIDRRIFETLADPAPEKLHIVIRINENIAAGLKAMPSQG
jgi:flagellar protein FlaF